MNGRFSSSGLSGACVDMLRADGIVAQVAFRPRHARDGAPFCIDLAPTVGAGDRHAMQVGSVGRSGSVRRGAIDVR